MKHIIAILTLSIFIAGCVTTTPVREEVRTYNVQGLAFSEKGLYDKAISEFDKAIEIDSKFADAKE